MPAHHTLVYTRRLLSIGGLTLATSLLAVAQQGAPGKTASQVYKNIQVLKDIPSTQLIPSMRFLSTALGVECEFCHLGTRAEDTPNKQIARKMMTMMLAINKQNFDGRLEVTCYTCHKGNHDPVNTPVPTGQYSAEGPSAFYRPTGAQIVGGGVDEVMAEAYKEAMKEEAGVRASLPKPEEILAKYVAALGGEQALRKITSRTITSTTELAPNVRGTGPMVYVQQTQYFKAPNLYMANLQRFNGTQTAKGFDGTNAWTQSANGTVAQLAGTDLERAKREADFYEGLNLKQEYTQLTVKGIRKVGESSAYLVIGTPRGDNAEGLYFDTKTGLLLRKDTYNTTALGNYTIQTDYEDYRDVGGVKIPFLIRTVSVSPADTVVIHVEKVENNPVIDAAKFAKPAPKPPRAAAQ